MSHTLIKLTGRDLAELVPVIDLPERAMATLQGCADVPSALERLESGGLLVEATRLVAHGLPKREAVWWACMCATHSAPGDLPDVARQARETAEQWVRQPSDTVRRAAMAYAQASGFDTAEAWAGVAAFWSGDSIAPAGQPPVAPAPHLAGTAVAGSVALAAARGDARRNTHRLKLFLESGRNIAAGGPGRLPAEQP